jgi:hypothetical protein
VRDWTIGRAKYLDPLQHTGMLSESFEGGTVGAMFF